MVYGFLRLILLFLWFAACETAEWEDGLATDRPKGVQMVPLRKAADCRQEGGLGQSSDFSLLLVERVLGLG